MIGRRPVEYPTGRRFVIAAGAPDTDGREGEVHERITIYAPDGLTLTLDLALFRPHERRWISRDDKDRVRSPTDSLSPWGHGQVARRKHHRRQSTSR